MNPDEEMAPFNKPNVSLSAPGSPSDQKLREEEEEKKKKQKKADQFPISGKSNEWLTSLKSAGWSEKDNNYTRPGDSTPTFGIEQMPDGRQALVFKKKDPESITTVIATMKGKGVELAFVGPNENPDFDRDFATRIYLEAKEQDVKTSGWEPDQQDIDRVREAEQSQVQRQELTLTEKDLEASYNAAVGSPRMTSDQALKQFEKFRAQYTDGNLGNDQHKALEAFTNGLTAKHNNKFPAATTTLKPDSPGKKLSR